MSQETLVRRAPRSTSKKVLALGLSAAALAGAQATGISSAHADGTATEFVGGTNYYVTAVWGNSQFVNNGQMRRWHYDAIGPVLVPQSTCRYQAHFFGRLSNNTDWSTYSSYASGCSPAFPAWADSPQIKQNFADNSLWCGEWKEDQTWSRRYACPTIHR